MADLNDLRNRLQDIINDLETSLLDVATSVSLAGKAVAERTIKDKGFGYTYSPSQLPAWWFLNKDINQRGEALVKARAKAKPPNNTIAWWEIRQTQGLQVAFVDLSYSNEMWRGMFPQPPYREGDQFIAPLGHNNEAGQDKMNWNRDRYGDFIGKTLTGENYEIMAEVAVQEVLRIIERNNL